MLIKLRITFLFFCLLPSIGFAQQLIKIGVLSHRGDEITLQSWDPLADYLSHSLPNITFKIVPLAFNEIDEAVASKSVQLLLVNPGIYVSMEIKYRISRIATLNKTISGLPHNMFGGVIFTRSDQEKINFISDLHNKTFMAVDKTSLGGYQMAWREMLDHKVNPLTDFKKLEFGGTHDKVVYAVNNGLVDAGTVRTGILESMDKLGLIKLSNFKVLNSHIHHDFPALHSTPLYPEWPISKLKSTPNALAQKVAIALFKLNENKADLARYSWSHYAGWTIPLEYQPINDILLDLHLPPYEHVGEFTLYDAINKYRYWLLTTLIFIITTILMMMRVQKLNIALHSSKKVLENHHSLILDSVADGIYGVDLNGDSTFINKAMENITGWSAEEMVGKNQHELLHHTKKDGSPHLAKDCPVYKTSFDEIPRFIKDDLFWTVDGKPIPVEYSSNPVKDAKSKTIGSVVVFRDISSRLKAEKQLRSLQSELEHVSRLSNMGEMASGMAHELNQPLTAILTNSEACIRLLDSNNVDTEQLMQILEIIGGQSKRASGIIQQLRQFVKKETVDLTHVNVNKQIKSLLTLIRYELDQEFITVKLELNTQLSSVLAQPIQIDQVILNLIRNAIEAMELVKADDRIIIIKTEEFKQEIKVTIMDTGTGIQEEIVDELFTPYKTTKSGGMGLGLSISEKIIQSHNGQLVAFNIAGAGANFSFTLPKQGAN